MFASQFANYFGLICYENDPPADPPTPPVINDPPPGETLTQEQFNKALAEDRRKHKAQLEKVEKQYTDLLANKRLTDEERSKLEEAREDLLKQMRSKEEQAKYEAKQKEQEFTTKLTAAEKRAIEAENKLTSFKIERSLFDAFATEAYNPEQVVRLFKGAAKISNEDQDKVVLDFDDEDSETKERIVTQKTPSEARERMKQLPHIYGNLLKSTLAGGVGGSGKPDASKPLNLKNMTMEQYAANREKIKEQLKR